MGMPGPGRHGPTVHKPVSAFLSWLLRWRAQRPLTVHRHAKVFTWHRPREGPGAWRVNAGLGRPRVPSDEGSLFVRVVL